MADYTVLTNSKLKNTSQVVIEFPVPGVGANAGNIQWRDLFAQLRVFNEETGKTINPLKSADTAYIAQLDAGEITELSLTVEYDANLTLVGKAQALDAAVSERTAEFTQEFADMYEYYGVERSV